MKKFAMTDRLRLLFLTNLPSPYKVEFYNEMLKYADVSVFYEKKRMPSRNKNWRAESQMKYNVIWGTPIISNDESAFSPNVISVIKNGNYDVIIVGYYSSLTEMLAIEYMKIHKIPFIFHTDGGIIKEDNNFLYKIKNRYISAASLWLSTGRSVTEYLCHYGAKKEKTYIYPFSSVHEDSVLSHPIRRDKKTEIKREIGIKEKYMVLSVGQFIYRKGYDLLLNTIGGLDSDIGIYIIGGQPTEEYLMLMEKKQLKNVHFVDFQTKEYLDKYYRASDIFVLPTREDIWGLVVNEALAYGLPVITTDKCVAGLELLDGCGKIVETTADWGTEISIMINNINDMYQSAQKDNMFDCCLKKAREYTIEKMAERQYEIISSIKI